MGFPEDRQQGRHDGKEVGAAQKMDSKEGIREKEV
jgi:hypothetical protein